MEQISTADSWINQFTHSHTDNTSLALTSLSSS